MQEFAAVAGAVHLRISAAQAGERVGVAAGESDLAVARGEGFGMTVGGWQHLAVQDLDGWKILGEVVEIGFGARAGESRERVIDGEQDLALVEVREQGGEIRAAAGP